MSGPWAKYGQPAATGPWAKYKNPEPSAPRAQMDPSEYDPASPEYQAKYGATSGMTWGDKFVAGVGKSFVDTGRGLRQLAAAAGIGDATAAQQSVDAAAQRDQALMDTGAGIAGNIGGQLAQFAVPGGALARTGSFGARLGRGAAFGAAIANTQPVTSEQTRAGNTTLGALGGAAGEGVAAGVGRLATGAASNIGPEVTKLAKRARELGIPLRTEQITRSGAGQAVSAALDAVPFSGRGSFRKAQVAGWNRALSRTVGDNDTNLTTALDRAGKRLGAKYDSVLGRYPVKQDAQLNQDIAGALSAARTELDDVQYARVEKLVEGLLSKTNNGEIDGQAAYNFKKMLDRLGKNPDSSLAHHAGEVKSSLMQALDRSLPPDVAKGFAKTRAQYGNLITLRKALRAGAEGTVTPARLASMNTRGELKELADIGAQFLAEPFGNSGTAQRGLGLALLGGAGVVDLGTAGTMAATGATLGRAVNAVQSSPLAVNQVLNGAPALRPLLPYTNALLPTAGAVLSQ